MREEIQSWFQGFGYEEGFDPSEVPLPKCRNGELILIYILNAIDLKERRKVLLRA